MSLKRLAVSWLGQRFCEGRAVRGGRRNTMRLGDLAEGLTTLAVLLDGRLIELEWAAADVLAFELGAPHAGPDPFDDEAALEFGNRTDDYDDGPAKRSAG